MGLGDALLRRTWLRIVEEGTERWYCKGRSEIRGWIRSPLGRDGLERKAVVVGDGLELWSLELATVTERCSETN